jgi:predicted ABC-type transport system involved in lysophospholipase L1 biosynthesis ATPase subunit
MCIPAFIANKPKQETEAEAKKLLDFLGLSHINHKPNALWGEQQRVAARALINKPHIFADEPSGNLIPHQQKTYTNYFLNCVMNLVKLCDCNTMKN